MSKVPYRLWSEEAAEPPPAKRTIVAKLKPSTSEGRRAAFGASLATVGTETRSSRLDRLIENARVRAVHPVFPEPRQAFFAGTIAGSSFPATRPAVVARARGLVTIEVARDEDPHKMARHLDSLGGEVEYAFVPAPRRMFAKKKAKPDPLASRQWGHAAVRIAQARALPGFHDSTGIVVAVADSGVDTSHPDLKGVIKEAKNFVRGESKRDFEGHGTHVAGTIAAGLNNGIGVSGLCRSKILSLKVLPARADWDVAGYYRALNYCRGRARVLNLSLGDEQFDPGEKDVIDDLVDAGIVVVAAMGNEYEEGNPIEYPAALKGVCAVGATDQADRRGTFSNTGSHLALCAPGVSIFSTTPTFSYPHGESNYDSFDGTSAAAPHVSAAAALILAANPQLTPKQVIRKLTTKARRVPAMKKRPSRSFGWGRLDIEAALR